MKVLVAKSAGFCIGVRKAMDRALDVSRGRPITYSLGPLVHNPQALQMLESRRVFVADRVDERLRNSTVVIRAHGVPPSVKADLLAIGANVEDATCPKVLRSQTIIADYHAQGYQIVIIGDRGHAEIDGLLGVTEGAGIVVENLAEAEALPHFARVCVVAQTTLNGAMFDSIAAEIGRHADDCHVANTICAATDRRQADVRRLAEETDATVVVGGRASANTKRLADISRELGQPTFLIEDVRELTLTNLAPYTTIGVTAGASTPHWVIQEVVDAIAAYTPGGHRSPLAWLETAWLLAIEGSLVTCLAAVALTYALCLFLGIPPYPRFLLLSFFYLFPMHTINKYREINWATVPTVVASPALRRYWRVLLILAALSSMVSIAIAWRSGALVIGLVAVSYLLAGFYSVRVLPMEWKTRFKSIRDIPGSKDVVIAAAWTFAVVVLPAITHDEFPGLIALAGAAYVFVLVFTKATILAIGGMQSDKLVGLETIPMLIGRVRTRQLLYLLNGVLAAEMLWLALAGALPMATLVLLIPVVWGLAGLPRFSRPGMTMRVHDQLYLDAAFFLAGILAFLALR